MSQYSNHHRFLADRDRVVDAMVAFLQCDPRTIFVEVAASKDEDDGFDRQWAVAPMADGWTGVWGTWGGNDAPLVAQVASVLGSDAMYGHNNDSVDNWRWIAFRGGQRYQEFWYLGQPEYEAWRWGNGSLPALDLWAAFRSTGPAYAHETFAGTLYRPDRRVVSWMEG